MARSDKTRIKVAGLVNDSITDGPGLRLSVFTQGCHHNCPGCHNPQTHDPDGGYWMTAEEILKEIERNPLLDGITVTGGEPFLQAERLLPLCREIKRRGYSLIIYTGYTWEELEENETFMELAGIADTVIDGRYEEKSRSLALSWRGSANQNIIDVAERFTERQP